jgi:ABC-type polysaccharide/polyol phosphate transport system ATPase subunit
MNRDIVIRVEDVTKCYQVYDRPHHRLWQTLRPGKRYYREFTALDRVSFQVGRGEAVGVIGRNGSGKSTLLQIITGVLRPTSGTVSVTGKIAALLELGSGFNPEFTGRENVFLNGAVLGIPRAQMERKFDDIAAFADIGSHLDQPVKTYSSGMMMRLAFAVQIFIEPEILVVDEALSVGDIFFQQKCFKHIRRILADGTTLLFVSHDTGAVQHLCNRAVLLRGGRQMFIGPPEQAISRYFAADGDHPATFFETVVEPDFSAPELGAGPPAPLSEATGREDGEPDPAHGRVEAGSFASLRHAIRQHDMLPEAKARHGNRDYEITGCAIVDPNGFATRNIVMGQTAHLFLLMRARRDIPSPSAGIQLYDRMSNLVFAAGTRQLRVELPPLPANREVIVELKLTLDVQPGEYLFCIGCSEPSSEGPNIGIICDRHEGLGPLSVVADGTQLMPFYGIARLPMAVSYVEDAAGRAGMLTELRPRETAAHWSS